MNDSLQTHGLYNPWNSPGQNTGVGAILFSRGSSQPRDQTQVSHIAGRFFTNWATIGQFEIISDHGAGKIVVNLTGRLNKYGGISLRFDVCLRDLEKR